jgi:hypothetical protein
MATTREYNQPTDSVLRNSKVSFMCRRVRVHIRNPRPPLPQIPNFSLCLGNATIVIHPPRSLVITSVWMSYSGEFQPSILELPA